MPENGSLKRIRSCSSPTPSESLSEASDVSYALSDFESRRERNRPLRVAIEGNIAAGKSTFLSILYDLVEKNETYEDLKWYVQPEPLSKWTKSEGSNGGKNLLDCFYKDPKRWAYTFEAYTFITRMQQAIDAEKLVQTEILHDNSSAPVITFFERSIYSSRLVFAENGFESSYLDTTEWALYCDWSSYLLKTVKQLKLDAIIYLQCDPKTCGERMKIRSRNEEASVPQEYLNQLHEKYETWLGKDGWNQEKPVKIDKTEIHATVKKALSDVPILVLDCTEEFEHDPKRRDKLVTKVKDFLFEITSKDQSDFEEECLGDKPNPLDMPLTPKNIFNTKKLPADKNYENDENISDIENQPPSYHNIPKRFRKQLTTNGSKSNTAN